MAGVSCGFTAEEYLKRIGYPNPKQSPECNIETLTRIQRLHSTAIPFDNFDFHIPNFPITLDAEGIWKKVTNYRGTYCFQGNYLLTDALRLLGYKASLIPVGSWRNFAHSFVEVPNHCCVVVEVGQKWYLVDVATVDCIDGILEMSVEMDVPQVVSNGIRYKFVLFEEGEFLQEEEFRTRVKTVDSTFFDKRLSFAVVKEDAKRNEDFDPVLPIEKEWVNRFGIKLKLRSGIDYPSLDSKQSLMTYCDFPVSLPREIAKILIDYTVYGDPKSHHHKQWLGIRYSPDGARKYIVAGFRYIEVDRPFSARKVERLEGANTPGADGASNAKIEEEYDSKIRQYLINEIGIDLSEEEKEKLNIRHNYTLTNVEMVWCY